MGIVWVELSWRNFLTDLSLRFLRALFCSLRLPSMLIKHVIHKMEQRNTQKYFYASMCNLYQLERDILWDGKQFCENFDRSREVFLPSFDRFGKGSHFNAFFDSSVGKGSILFKFSQQICTNGNTFVALTRDDWVGLTGNSSFQNTKQIYEESN